MYYCEKTFASATLRLTSLQEDYVSYSTDIRFGHVTCVIPSCRRSVHPHAVELRSVNVNFFGQ